MSDQPDSAMEETRSIDWEQAERAIAPPPPLLLGLAGENRPYLTQQEIDDAAFDYWDSMRNWFNRELLRTTTLPPAAVPGAGPPFGLMPRWLHEERRAEALIAAIGRYEAAGLDPLPEWRAELADLGEAVARSRDREFARAVVGGTPAAANAMPGEPDAETAESWRKRPGML